MCIYKLNSEYDNPTKDSRDLKAKPPSLVHWTMNLMESGDEVNSRVQFRV